MRNERHFGRSRQFFRFAGGASSSAKSIPSSNSTVSDGIPTGAGSLRTLIDGTIFMTWVVLGALFMLILGKIAPGIGPKNTCKNDQIFMYKGFKNHHEFSFKFPSDNAANNSSCNPKFD